MLGILRFSCDNYSTSRGFSSNLFIVEISNHTNIIYPDLFMQYCENCFFILNTFTFERTVDNISWTNSFHYVIFSCNERLQWIWLDYLVISAWRSWWCSVLKNFSYSLKNYSILLKKFYLYNQRNYKHLTQEIWGSLTINAKCVWELWDEIITFLMTFINEKRLKFYREL